MQTKPNLLAWIMITDYENPKAFTIPTAVILNDDKGKFVYVAKKDGKDLTATKNHIEVGLSFEGETEILNGLKGNEDIVVKGFRELSEGYAIKISNSNNELTWK